MLSLIALKKLLQEKGRANIMSLANYFKTSIKNLEAPLTLLINKGYIALEDRELGCGTSCNKCEQKSLRVYCWVFSD
jgi:hypothetical protein